MGVLRDTMPHRHGGTDAPECTTCTVQQPCANCPHPVGSHNAFGRCLDMIPESKSISRGCTCSGYEGYEPVPADDGLDWPCDRHEAHGPHPALPTGCPGVGAHPNTMIGRNDVPKRGEFRD